MPIGKLIFCPDQAEPHRDMSLALKSRDMSDDTNLSS